MTFNDGTRTATAGIDRDPAFGAVMPPLYLSANYSFTGLDEKRDYDYTRSGNPTRDVLAAALSDLEAGAGGVVTASGMAAVDLVLTVAAARSDLVIAPHDCYGGTHRLLEARRKQGAFDVAYVDLCDIGALNAALEKHPKLILVETPTNPLMRIADLRWICGLARAAGAAVAVDNTFLSPARQKPISFGADYVIHSTTKYINGHSDVVGGAVIAAEDARAEALAWWANCTGVTGAPFDSYLTLRGLRTLHTRIAAQEASAGKIARFLAARPEVSRVHYPGLPTHPGHVVAARQQSGFGAMLSFELGGGLDAARRFVQALPIFTLAESLGGFESLIAHPATMTHKAMTPEARVDAGITDGLLRLSVGLEDGQDLIMALGRTLDSLEAASVTAARSMTACDGFRRVDREST